MKKLPADILILSQPKLQIPIGVAWLSTSDQTQSVNRTFL